MVVDFSKQVYIPAFNTFARPVVFTPAASQPGQPAYTKRGIYSTQPLDIAAEDNSIFSDQITVLDVVEEEFPVIPLQGDLLTIPAYLTLPSLGDFEIIDGKTNGGGQTSFNLRQIVPKKPVDTF